MRFLFLPLFCMIFYSNLVFAGFSYEFCKFKAEETKMFLAVPKKVDDITTLTDVTCKESIPETIQYIYSVDMYFTEQNRPQAIDFLKKNIFPKLTTTFCSTAIEEVKLFDIEFIYTDKSGGDFISRRITLKDCSKFLKFSN